MSARGYRDRRTDRCRLFLGLVPFKLVVPPLQPGVLEPYLVWGTWFPSRLLLEEIGLCLDFLGHNRWPAIPEVQDSNKFPCPFKVILL
jgi:hypothetical protein